MAIEDSLHRIGGPLINPIKPSIVINILMIQKETKIVSALERLLI